LPSNFREKLLSFQCYVIGPRKKKHSYPTLDEMDNTAKTPVVFFEKVRILGKIY